MTLEEIGIIDKQFKLKFAICSQKENVRCSKLKDQIIENEVKLRIGHSAFLDLLKKHGIRFSVYEPISQRDLIFDFPDLRLLKRDQLFRIRLENEQLKLTFKGKRGLSRYSKRRIEIEENIGSKRATDILKRIGIQVSELPFTLEEIIKLLVQNGMNIVVEVVKERNPVILEGWHCKVYLDKVRDLGEFVEIEGEGADLLVDILGVSKAVVRESYAEMLARFSSNDSSY